MDLPSKAWESQVDERIQDISLKLGQDVHFNEKDAPGLKSLLDDYLDPNVPVNDVEFTRRMLKVFKESETDYTYSKLLDKHTPEEQRRIEKFLAGDKLEDIGDGFVLGPSLGCRDELQKLHEASSIVHVGPEGVAAIKNSVNSTIAHQKSWFHETIQKLEEFFDIHKDELEKAGVLVYHNAKFQNWGLTVDNVPSITCVPKTVKAIQVIVKFAKKHQMSVRCSGYRHSWTPIFSSNGQILISLLNLDVASVLPNFAALPLPEHKPTELETIEIVSGKPRDSPDNSLVRIGSATINERLRRWCVEHDKVTIPYNIIMVEITAGGANGPICHGAGRKHQTLSDLVRKIEYVDANGELQVVEKPEHLRAAAGCFGLIGVITHLTLEFSPMSYAKLAPLKIPVIQAVPPPADLDEKDIPPALLKYWTPLSSAQKAACQAEFERNANDDYYSEWFWFPYSDYSWVNCWNTTTEKKDVVTFPDDAQIFLQFVQSFAMNLLQNAPLMNQLISATHLSEAAVTLISRFAMEALPTKKLTTYLTDALYTNLFPTNRKEMYWLTGLRHFRRAIQNVRVRDLEVEMPLVGKAENLNVVDYHNVQRAWWDAILLTYQYTQTCPMRMPLEMRIMGGSDIILAPQHYNTLGTCSIEILTLVSAKDIWTPFAQAVLDKWMALKDPVTGERLRTRPHWAKEWYNELTVDGKPWIDRVKNVDYKVERGEFLDVLAEIGKEAGWSVQDMRNRFSNPLFDELFFGEDLAVRSDLTNRHVPH